MKRYSLMKCVYYNWIKLKKKKLRLMIKPGSNLYLDNSADVVGNGRLFFNTNKPERFRANCYFQMQKDTVLELETDNFFHYGSDVCIFEGGRCELHGCSLNAYSQLRCKKHISIGSGTIIGRSVQIWDADHHTFNGDREGKDIIIGNHVWIGSGAMILKGVNIGDGAVVAAGAVVNKDIPKACLAAGVPARVIQENVEWEY